MFKSRAQESRRDFTVNMADPEGESLESWLSKLANKYFVMIL